MTARYKTRAFVFKKNDLNEADRNFSVFSDDFGRLDIFAKAIRKATSKLKSGMDIFFMSEIEFIQGKNKKTLTDAVATEKFSNLSQSPEKFEIAMQIAQILDNFLKGQEKDQNIFNLLGDTFNKLNNSKFEIRNSKLLHYYFIWNFLSLLGYHLEVKTCAGCHEKLNPYNVYFSCKEGGVICKECSKPGLKQKINSDIVKILRIILANDWQTLSKLKIEASSQKLLAEVSETAINSFCP